jgi:hypothetical protein
VHDVALPWVGIFSKLAVELLDAVAYVWSSSEGGSCVPEVGSVVAGKRAGKATFVLGG